MLPNEMLGLKEGGAKAGRTSNVKVEKVARVAAGAAATAEEPLRSGVIVTKSEKAKKAKEDKNDKKNKSRVLVVMKKGDASEKAVEAALAACIRILEDKKKVHLGYLGGKMDQLGVDMEAIRAVYGTFKDFVLSRAELILTKGEVTLASSFDEKEASCFLLLFLLFSHTLAPVCGDGAQGDRGRGRLHEPRQRAQECAGARRQDHRGPPRQRGAVSEKVPGAARGRRHRDNQKVKGIKFLYTAGLC